MQKSVLIVFLGFFLFSCGTTKSVDEVPATTTTTTGQPDGEMKVREIAPAKLERPVPISE